MSPLMLWESEGLVDAAETRHEKAPLTKLALVLFGSPAVADNPTHSPPKNTTLMPKS
jgi:hypothetical protein